MERGERAGTWGNVVLMLKRGRGTWRERGERGGNVVECLSGWESIFTV